MSIEENKELFRRWSEEGLNIEHYSDDLVHHQLSGATQSKKEMSEVITRLNMAGTKASIEDILAEGDRVYVFIRFSGPGESVTRNFVYRIQDGKIAESWQRGGTGAKIPGF